MILKLVDIATDPWGIRVTRVEIKDLRLPFDIQRSMAAEAESSREATAKVTKLTLIPITQLFISDHRRERRKRRFSSFV